MQELAKAGINFRCLETILCSSSRCVLCPARTQQERERAIILRGNQRPVDWEGILLVFDTREIMQSQRNCTSGLRMPRLPNSFLPSVAMRQSLLAHDILMCSFDRVLAQRRGRVASTCGGFRFPNNNHRITTPCGVPARDFSAAGQSVY